MAARQARAEALLARVGERIAAQVAPGRSVCAAISGGLDSTVLLDILARRREAGGFVLSALHVHHGLSPNADRWAEACAGFARSRAVELRVERVRVDGASGAGLEAAARAARHEAFRTAGTDFLALAHHRDDQAETVLLQALRGAGIRGLSAMAGVRAVGAMVWLRPLLDEPREDLLAYAREAGLAWVEDESNATAAFDRNVVRHEVFPRLARTFPQYRESLARLARHAAAAQEILDSVAREDTDRISDGEGLVAARLAALPAPRRANVLRYFLAGQHLPMPAEARLAEMARQLMSPREDARVLLHHGGRVLVRHRGRIVVQAPPPARPWRLPWQGDRVVDLGPDIGEVRFSEAAGSGIALDRVAAGRWHFAHRAGGERIRLRPDGPSRTLKNLLQERAVPVWQRGRLPLLFDGGTLVWVPGVGIAAAYRASGRDAGLDPVLAGPARGAAADPAAAPCARMKS
jgi:tRNA(Ile)-lysidine synthase